LNTAPDRPHRVPLAGRFDADALSLLAGRADRSALGGSRRHGPRSPIPNRTRTRAELPCQTHDPDMWFADAPHDLERAKALCQDCPAQLACLTDAIERREPTGVWGGQILDKGEIVTHKRSRGRPRKGSTMPQRHPYHPRVAPRADGKPCDVQGAA
jgi:WhiB family transcriptional regulator, redox-sensing transcriptional regulator